jgi:uncharacterized protein YyaL (SSP411 family)
MIQACIELNFTEPTGDWLGFSLTLQSQLDQRFWSSEHSSYLMTAHIHAQALLPIREDYDGAEPAPNHIAAENLLKLHALTGNEDFLTKAQLLINAGAANLTAQPYSAPALLNAYDLSLRGAMKYEFPAFHMLDHYLQKFLPRAVFTINDTATQATLCEGYTCKLLTS